MTARISLAKFFIGLNKFIESMPVLVMKPKDLIEYSKRHYLREIIVKSWAEDELMESGLTVAELAILEQIPYKTGKLLLLGVGGGREAIPMAKKGFEVTGVDFVEDMVNVAMKNAEKNGLKIKGIVQDIIDLDLPRQQYDIVWFSTVLYSAIPSRHNRIKLLRDLKRTLNQNGYLVCQFMFHFNQRFKKPLEWLKKLIILFSLGNFSYEKGDMLWGNVEFLHKFISEASLITEIEEAGFKVMNTGFPEGSPRGYALVTKKI